MAEKIIDGGFAADLNDWDNIGQTSFWWASSRANAESSPNHDDGVSYNLAQSFSIAGAAVSAVLNAAYGWNLKAGDVTPGAATFTLRLRKPDDSLVNLASDGQDASLGDNADSGKLADDLDVSAHLDQVGTYRLEMLVVINSGMSIPLGEPIYYPGSAWYDTISLAVVERLTKTVVEYLSGGDTAPAKIRMGVVPGGVVFGEVLDYVGGQEAPFFIGRQGLRERYSVAVFTGGSEGAGLLESLERTYGYRTRIIPGNTCGLRELLIARYEIGNVTLRRNITGLVDIWTRTEPGETSWEA